MKNLSKNSFFIAMSNAWFLKSECKSTNYFRNCQMFWGKTFIFLSILTFKNISKLHFQRYTLLYYISWGVHEHTPLSRLLIRAKKWPQKHAKSVSNAFLSETVCFLKGKYVFFISDWEWDKFLSRKKKRLRIRNKQNVASCCDLHNHPKNSFGCKGTIFNRG